MYIEKRTVGLRINLLVPVGLIFLILLNGVHASIVMLLAAVVHELGHILAANAAGVPIVRFDLELWGGRLCYGGLNSYKQELIVSCGGILANLLLCPLGLIPIFGLYGKLFFYSCICYALINMIPARTLDGGEILRCLLCMQSVSGFECAERAIHLLSSFFMLALGVSLCLITGFNLSVLFICLFSLVLTVTDTLTG